MLAEMSLPNVITLASSIGIVVVLVAWAIAIWVYFKYSKTK